MSHHTEKTLRIIYRIKPRESCRKLFSDNQIMTFYSLYLYSTGVQGSRRAVVPSDDDDESHFMYVNP
jgi:hypothetical protein